MSTRLVNSWIGFFVYFCIYLLFRVNLIKALSNWRANRKFSDFAKEMPSVTKVQVFEERRADSGLNKSTPHADQKLAQLGCGIGGLISPDKTMWPYLSSPAVLHRKRQMKTQCFFLPKSSCVFSAGSREVVMLFSCLQLDKPSEGQRLYLLGKDVLFCKTSRRLKRSCATWRNLPCVVASSSFDIDGPLISYELADLVWTKFLAESHRNWSLVFWPSLTSEVLCHWSSSQSCSIYNSKSHTHMHMS